MEAGYLYAAWVDDQLPAPQQLSRTPAEDFLCQILEELASSVVHLSLLPQAI